MEANRYIHGTHPSEQERLAGLNALTNPDFLRFAEREIDLSGLKSLLAVGSGLGILTHLMADRTAQGYAIGLEYAASQLGKTDISRPGVRFVRGDAHVLPFAADTFDLAYCRYLLEHVMNPVAALREMRRVLKPGGKALFQENNMMMVAFDPDCPYVDALMLSRNCSIGSFRSRWTPAPTSRKPSIG